MREIRQAIELLTSPSAEFDTVDLQPDGSVRLVAFGGASIHLTIHEYRLSGDEHVAEETSRDLFRSRPEWDEATLLRRNLPPEWNRHWLVRQLALLGSPEAVADQENRPLDEIIYFRGIHAIDNARREYARTLWDSGEFRTRGELAQHMGISDSTLSDYIGKITDGKRADQNDVLRAIVQEALKTHSQASARDFNDLVVQRAAEAGDRRNRRKLVSVIKRLRDESGQ